jgi:hypothetical protein
MMDWLTITPTHIELELEGETPLALLASFLEKMQTAGLERAAVGWVGGGLIYRFDGNLYDYAEYRFQAITPAPDIELDLESINP